VCETSRHDPSDNVHGGGPVTPAETAVLDVATRLVAAGNAHPDLVAAVGALKDGPTMKTIITTARSMSPRAAACLVRQGWNLDRFLHRSTTADVQDIPSASWHTWAIWVLAARQHGLEPTWYRTWAPGRRSLDEQIEHELRRATTGGVL
jgi:hypothetical protein